MANDLLNPPEIEKAETESHRDDRTVVPGQSSHLDSSMGSSLSGETGHELDAFLGRAFEEKSSFASLYEAIHEAFFPTKLPPLELTSKPVAVVDPMATKRDATPWIIASVVNFAILALLLFAFRAKIIPLIIKPTVSNMDVNLAPYKPKTPKAGNIGGGGGGGAHELTPASKGKLPKFDPKPILPPQIARNEAPKLPVPPAIDVQNVKLPDNPNLPNFGATQGPNVVLSNGAGSGGGIGNGKGGGVGTGNGNGFGPGTGGNTGGGLRRIGDGVTEPKPIFAPEAEFSDEARRAKYEGTVVVTLIVDAQGNPQNVHVTRSLGMGLDEKALEAVRQYKFKPAMDISTHKPVPVLLSIEVRFRLY